MPPKRASLADRVDAPEAEAAARSGLWGDERAQQPVIALDVRQIMPNRRQPRANPAEANLEELAESIRAHGVVQPIIVRPIPLTKYEGHGRTYEIVAGERRWRASQIAGRETIPALVRSDALDHRGMLELALIENVQRQDLHPLDEAAAFGQMQEELGYSYAEIAGRIGKSKGYVQNRMRLLQLPDDLRELVAARPDTLAHVYEIARVDDRDARAALIAAVRDDALSRAATRERVQRLLAGEPEAASAATDESYFQKYDRDATHEVSPPSGTSESYFQKYDRDTNHKRGSTAPVVIEREGQALLAVLARWEAAAAGLSHDDRAALLRFLDAASVRLEGIAQKLVDPAET